MTIREVNVVTSWNELIMSVLSGDTVILINGWAQGISGSTRGGEFRAITEPSSQVVIRGPKDGFTESIGTNISLVRRRIKSPNLWLEHMKIGAVTQTDIGIMYIKGIVNDKLVEEVKDRLQAIEIDAILESGYIEQLIQDETFTPFPTMLNTERPDSVAGNLLEGRVAIFVDGTPFVLVAPTTFFLYFQSAEDYYQRFDIGLAIRLLRYLAFFISLLGPSIYIAAITFHQEMIPTPLLISLAAQRDGVPFPTFVEAVMMEITFEILREAGVRMPRCDWSSSFHRRCVSFRTSRRSSRDYICRDGYRSRNYRYRQFCCSGFQFGDFRSFAPVSNHGLCCYDRFLWDCDHHDYDHRSLVQLTFFWDSLYGSLCTVYSRGPRRYYSPFSLVGAFDTPQIYLAKKITNE